jgi:hypothetical protein
MVTAQCRKHLWPARGLAKNLTDLSEKPPNGRVREERPEQKPDAKPPIREDLTDDSRNL